MNREQLEKLIDDKFPTIESIEWEGVSLLKNLVIETIIPEVLKSVIPEREKLKLGSENQDEYVAYSNGYNNCIKNIKQKAKEQFNINL